MDTTPVSSSGFTYINIDGDDVGRKIACHYISDDEIGLRQLISDLTRAVSAISNLLKAEGFIVLLSAADGVVAKTSRHVSSPQLFIRIRKLASPSLTFSSGVGCSLREAYIALLFAKCSGKNSLVEFKNIPSRADRHQ